MNMCGVINGTKYTLFYRFYFGHVPDSTIHGYQIHAVSP